MYQDWVLLKKIWFSQRGSLSKSIVRKEIRTIIVNLTIRPFKKADTEEYVIKDYNTFELNATE